MQELWFTLKQDGGDAILFKTFIAIIVLVEAEADSGC